MRIVIILVIVVNCSEIYGFKAQRRNNDIIPHDEIPLRTVTIDLQWNLISELKENEFSNYKNLTWLNLNLNKLRFMHDTALLGTKLKRLSLSHNLLKDFPNITYLGNTLTHLYLHHNRISNISVEMLSPLKHLEHLFLSHNPLNIWPDFSGIGSLASSTLLDVAYTYVPQDTPFSICHIESIHLAGHKLYTGVPLFNCRNGHTVHTIDLRDKGLTNSSLFVNLRSLYQNQTLSKLQIGSNPFEYFPSLPLDMRSNLINLDLSRTDITSIPINHLEGFTKLGTLYFGWSNIIKFPCKILGIAARLYFNDIPTLDYESSFWRQCMCEVTGSKLRYLYLSRSFNSLQFFPDLSEILCNWWTKYIYINLSNLKVPCDCSAIWVRVVQSKCSTSIVLSALPCGLRYWHDVQQRLRCPDSFALLYSGSKFNEMQQMVATSFRTNVLMPQSMIIRGTNKWLFKFHEKLFFLTPDIYPDLLHYVANCNIFAQDHIYQSIQRYVQENISLAENLKFSLLLSKPVTASIDTQERASCVNPLVYDNVLSDENLDTCIHVNNNKQEIILTRKQPTIYTGFVRVSSKGIDCTNKFHLMVSVNLRSHKYCILPMVCRIFESSTPDECLFLCDCVTNQCLGDGHWYIRLAHVKSAAVCEVEILTY